MSLHLWTLYLSHLLPDHVQISFMDYFYQTFAQVGILVMSDNQDGRHSTVCMCSTLT